MTEYLFRCRPSTATTRCEPFRSSLPFLISKSERLGDCWPGRLKELAPSVLGVPAGSRLKELAMLKKNYIFAALLIVAAPAVASVMFHGLARALAISVFIAGVAAWVFAVVGSSWLQGPYARSLEPGDGHEAGAALEKYHQRRTQVSMLAALVIYFGAGLGVTVAYHGWSAWEGYLRLHILDGFGCAGFFAVGWSQMDRDFQRGNRLLSPAAASTLLLTTATASIAAAAAFVAEVALVDVLLIGVLGWVYGYFVWDSITRDLHRTLTVARYGRKIRDFVARRPRPENPGSSAA